MILCALVTSWAGQGSQADPFRPQLAVDYPGVAWSDVSGQYAGRLPPAPNSLVVEARLDQADYQALLSNADYHVLWSELV
jgi:hypothetical protein